MFASIPAPRSVGDVTSALDVAQEYASAHDLPEWGSVLARSQSAGRGQVRREWHSPPGNMYAALRLPHAAPFLGTEAAPALGGMVVSALRGIFADTGLDIRLKWPNDVVLLRGGAPHKIGGILLEERGGILLAGIGINLVSAPPPDAMRAGHAMPAACLASALPAAPAMAAAIWGDAGALWARLVSGLFFCYGYGLQKGGWQGLAEAHLLWRGCAVVLEDDTPRHGVLLGLGPSGGARVRTDGHVLEFLSGVLRGADGTQ